MKSFRLAGRKEMVILDEDMAEAKTHMGRDKDRGKWPRLCADLRAGRPGLGFLLLI